MTKKSGKFSCKTEVTFGSGAIRGLGDLVRSTGALKFLLVADAALEKLGIVQSVVANLTAAGLDGKVFTGVEPEPYLDNAEQSATLGREAAAQVVIGIGGGSAMDTAKAAAILMTNDGKAQDYVGLNLVPKPGVPTVMVPTTAGTGSEVTFTAVFTNRETKAKGGINSEFMFPVKALLDPDLTVPLPPDVTASTGMDALTHAIESVTSRSCSVFTEALAFAAIRLISENLRRAVFHPDDVDAREKMFYGSVLGGMALADAGVGAAHALAYPLGGLYRIPHGLANAVLIPYVMEFNLPAAPEQFAMIARSMGEPIDGVPARTAGALAVDAVAALCEDIGIPSSLSELGIPRSDIPNLVEGALKVTRPIENNPRLVGPDEAEAIYEQAFG